MGRFANLKMLTFLTRALLLRCPVCGSARIAERPFHISHSCPACDSVFKREAGFFVGAILANVVTTELVVLAVCYFALLVLGVSYSSVLWLLFLVAAIFPVAFYHHSWSLWLTFDHLIEGLPKRRVH